MLFCIFYMRKIIINIFLSLVPLFSVGQEDSLIVVAASVVQCVQKNHTIGLVKLDTTLNNCHYFYPNYSDFVLSNGNFGAPIISLEWKFDYDWNFRFQDNYSYYELGISPYILSNVPYTRLFYSNGTNEEQYVNVIHSQRIKEGWNITAELDKINSTGFYSNQKTDNTIANISSSYISDNKKFIQLSNYRFTRYSGKENGGILNDLDFENNRTSKQYISVQLEDASNVIREHEAEVFNYIKLGESDTASSNRYGYLLNKLLLLDVNQTYKDSDADSIYYSSVIPNAVYLMKDSVQNNLTQTSIGWQNFDPIHPKNQILVTVDLGYEIRNYFVNEFSKNLQSAFISGSLAANSGNRIIGELNVSVRNNLLGYPTNKVNINGLLGYKIDSLQGTKLWLSGFFDRSSPNYRNYLNWSSAKNINEIETLGLGLNYKNDRLNNLTDLNFISLKNAVYFDSLFQVSQYEGSTGLLKARFRQNFRFKKLYFNTSLLYQKILGKDVFRVPELTVFSSLYFESFLFQKATLMRFGLDFYYNTAYYANGYFPMYRSFYIQDEKKIGNYPYFDIYIAAQIRMARVYVKISHMNSGFMGNTYYASPNYPIADRMLRLGVDWTFWN